MGLLWQSMDKERQENWEIHLWSLHFCFFFLILDCSPSICQQRSLWSLLEKCIFTKTCSQNCTSSACNIKKKSGPDFYWVATIGQVHSISIWEIGVSKEELDPDMKIQSWHFKIKTDAHLPLKCSCLRKMALGIIIFMENKLPTCNFRQMYSILKNFLKKSYSKILITWFHCFLIVQRINIKILIRLATELMLTTWEHRNRTR